MDRPPPFERTVNPRKTGAEHMPVVAVDLETDRVYLNDGRELGTYDDFVKFIAGRRRSLVVVAGADRLLARLDSQFRESNAWQFRVSPVERQVFRPNAERAPWLIKQTIVSFFGFRWSSKLRTYHYPLDPYVLTGKGINQLYPEEGDPLFKLLAFGYDVREFLVQQDLPIRPTMGGISSALLRDPRFYPEPRRKMPRATNDRGREALPGNFYELYAPRKKRYQALYFDQEKAHHNAAKDIAFPDANSLVACGSFHDRSSDWIKPTDRRRLADIQKCFGLLYARVTNPPLPAGPAFVPHFMRRPGPRTVFLFTNEIPLFLAAGGRIESVICAWISKDSEPGLNRYAEWAIGELGRSDEDRRKWLKPTLLASYGMLAARPRKLESGYRRAKSGDVRYYPAGGTLLEVIAKETSRAIELPIVNAIHRGMIEAETRARSLAFARDLHSMGRNVLAVYADSVFIEDDGWTVPILPPPWKVEAALSDLVFLNPTSFMSRELTKLPGVPRDARFRVARRDAFRAAGRDSLRGSSQTP